ncbi:hypothetical protein LJC23_07420, partial [Desulfovibrio sp. OttesenSCG-928-I05]|nr:hypothetical protein [Desulfovibrio sp. OttesenSCG-928-I05]
GTLGDKVRAIAVALTGFGVCFTLIGLATTFGMYLAAMGAAGFFLPLFATSETVLIQENVDPAMMGRVFSILQLVSMSSMPFAMMLFGPLADRIAIEPLLVVTGALLAITGLVFARAGRGKTINNTGQDT